MSLDVYLLSGEGARATCPHCGGSCEADGAELYEANITHNLSGMADAAGLYGALWRPEEIGASKAEHIAPILRDGLQRLRAEPERFKQFDPPNKWGSYEGLVRFTENYLRACEQYPDAVVKVSR